MKNLLPTPSTSVETAKTKKWWTWRNVLWTGALLLALALPWNASAQEQISPEKKDSIECIVPTQTQKQDSSTISYNEAKQLLNGEKREISTEEIQEYIQNNREEFEEYIKNNGKELNKIIDKQTMDILYEQLANNEDVKSMINEMINRDDIRDAVIKGNTEYIQEQIKEELYYKFNLNRFEEALGKGIIFLFKAAVYGFIWLFMLYIIASLIKAIVWKFEK